MIFVAFKRKVEVIGEVHIRGGMLIEWVMG